MPPDLEIQRVSLSDKVPTDEQFGVWVRAATAGYGEDFELVIRVVDETEARRHNRRYRGRDYPTNVLSFPADPPEGLPDSYRHTRIGDLLICAPVVEREAAQQGKQLADHWAHLVVHGILHLLGYDHDEPALADAMELRERRILANLGIPDPYVVHYD